MTAAADALPPRALTINIDGGASPNPGPAAIGIVVSDPDGAVILEVAETIGETSNNVAEYRALLRGIECAVKLGADQVTFVNDSELIAKQVNGTYKVKHPDMKRLHDEALAALEQLPSWSIRTVPRAQNAAADALVNAARNGER